MTGAADDGRRASRWRALWLFLGRIEAAASESGTDLLASRLDRHARRLAALEAEVACLRAGAPSAAAILAHSSGGEAGQG